MSTGDDPHGIEIVNRLEKTVVGVVVVRAIDVAFASDRMDAALAQVTEERSAGLADRLERVRAEARNMLRNGVYKPTGRGKPASEYLLRAAGDPTAFPRVNWPVDVCNFISLKYLLPISIWDMDASGARRFVFRLGKPGEEYVFNTAGQTISLQDLAVGCRAGGSDDPDGIPIVNPVKDSMSTKTSDATRFVAAAVYGPVAVADLGLDTTCAEFADWLAMSSDAAEPSYRLAMPGETVLC